jgi:hypothetical protein
MPKKLDYVKGKAKLWELEAEFEKHKLIHLIPATATKTKR